MVTFEQILQLVVILFLLSMVCERIADFLKNYLSGSKVLKIGDTLTKHPYDPFKEQARKYRIMKINVWSGILLALVLKADMIMMLNKITDPGKTLGWNYCLNYDGIEWIMLPFGIILTGCFISFGSKFWHDLLDILYEIKQVKRTLADPETYKSDNITSLQKVYSTYPSDFIKAAYLEANTQFMAMDHAKAFGIKSDSSGYYFELTLSKEDPSIGEFYEYLLDGRIPQKIPIKTVVLTEDDSIKALNLNLSAKVFNMDYPSEYGTVGVVVKKKNDQSGKKYLLTCCHNVIEPFGIIDDTNQNSIDAGVIYSNVETKIGTVHRAFIDHEIDAALIEITPDNQDLILNLVPQMGRITNYRELKNEDQGNLTTTIYGAKTYGSKGVVNTLHHNVEISYDKIGYKKRTLMNLVQISNNSSSGDSGCCVVDNQCNLLGLVVAGSKHTTYMMPIRTLLTKLNLQII